MSKTIKLIAFLVLFLPASLVFTQATAAWIYTPKLRFVVAETTTSQLVYEIYFTVASSEAAPNGLWFHNATMAVLFESDDVSTADLETFAASYTFTAYGGVPFVAASGSSLTVTFFALPIGNGSLVCEPVSGNTCDLLIGKFTHPSTGTAPSGEISMALARIDTTSPPSVANPGAIKLDAMHYISGLTSIVWAGPTIVREAAADGKLTFPPPSLAVNLDVNGDGFVTGHDALILYFASPQSGVRASLFRATSRRNLLGAYAPGATDDQLAAAVAAANTVLDDAPATVDFNGDTFVNGDDAAILYFASPQSGVSASLSRARFRRILLGPYAPAGATDEQLLAAVVAAGAVLSP